MTPDAIDPATIATAIRAGDAPAMQILYEALRHRFRGALSMFGAEEFDDQLHDAFVIVVQAIQSDRLRDARALFGYAAVVIRRLGYDQINRRVISRVTITPRDLKRDLASNEVDPESRLLNRDYIAIARETLALMRQRDREILTRFYVLQESPATVCTHMRLNSSQYRLLKSRAKARFVALARQLTGASA